VFTWTYNDLKGIPLEFAQHIIVLDTLIPPTHQTRYKLNLNYGASVKHDINKLLVVGFIQLVHEATWLSPIVVVPKRNEKLKICADFKKLNKATKKTPYSLPFSDEVLNTIARYEAYSFLDGYLIYDQTFVALENRCKITFVTN
jgi:hypothetical protein